MANDPDPRDPELEATLARHLGKIPPPAWRTSLKHWLLGPEPFKPGGPKPEFLKEIRAYQRVGSTMDVAQALAEAGAPEATLVWAVRQEQGRGRQGRVWESPEGGLYCSLILRPSRDLSEIPQLSLVAGLAVGEAIRDATSLFPKIRWPNDLLLEDRKVGGILVEAKSGAVIIGIGINVTTKPSALPDSATSLLANTIPQMPRPEPYPLTGALVKHFQRWYEEWSANGFAPIREALRSWMAFFGRPVHVTAGSVNYEGTLHDLDEAGRLLVRLDTGIIKQFEMGEVTLLR